MSVPNCNFDALYYGSGKCSQLRLSDIDRDVVVECSDFAFSSFDDACGKCVAAISQTLDQTLKNLAVDGNYTEEATCLVGIIVSVIAGKMNGTFGFGPYGLDSGIEDLNRCLPALALPGWKINLSLSLFVCLTHTVNYILLTNDLNIWFIFFAEAVNYIKLHCKYKLHYSVHVYL